MKIKVPLENGFLPDKFGKFAPEKYQQLGEPIRSFPIEISDIPTNTVALALVLIDYDAVPVAGFPWIHWIATDIKPTNLIPENASRDDKDMIQGKNSNYSKFINITDETLINHYVGPNPPTNHNYNLSVFALSKKTGLKNGFFLNDLLKAIDPITIDLATIAIPFRG